MSFFPMRANSGVSLQIFSNDLFRRCWANAGSGSTATWITDSTEATLALGPNGMFEELNKLIGLGQVKQEINSLIGFVRFQEMREKQ
jgi:hypothetical protein